MHQFHTSAFRQPTLLLQATSGIRGNGAVEYTRVLVHPTLAVKQMDIFPSVTTSYENQRSPVNKFSNGTPSLDFMKLLRSQLKAAYASYLGDREVETDNDEKLKDLERLPVFEAFINNLCMVTQPAAGTYCAKEKLFPQKI